MDKKVLLRLLSHKADDIQSVIASMADSGEIFDIEIDILKSKIRDLYDDAGLLCNVEIEAEPEAEPVISEPQVEIQPQMPDAAAEDVEEAPVEREETTEPILPPVFPEIKITEQHSEKPKSSFLTGVKMEAVNDIMVAIGLNDRFLFTRELFNNDSDLFFKTIKELNQKNSWNDALSYLNEHFNWDKDDQTVELFQSFVKRRFI